MDRPFHSARPDPLARPSPGRRVPALALVLLPLLFGARAALGAEPAAPASPAPPLFSIPQAATPLPGVLTSGQPTEEQLAAVARAGYKTVVNLRTAGEPGTWDEAPKAAELGLRYVSIPMKGADDLTEANVRALAEVLADPQAYPVVVHCATSNRVGALFALKAFQLDGASAEEALELGRKAGLKGLEAAVRERLQLKE